MCGSLVGKEVVMESIRPAHPIAALVPVVGPLALGLAVGGPFGLFAAGHEAIATPAIFLGVAALMVPALYVITSLFQIAPSLAEFSVAVGDGLWAGGVALLGLAVPVGFVVATGTSTSALGVGCGAFAIGVGLALTALFHRLFRDVGTELVHFAVYTGWAAVGCAIGGVLYVREALS
jgi:hypothetical protein